MIKCSVILIINDQGTQGKPAKSLRKHNQAVENEPEPLFYKVSISRSIHVSEAERGKGNLLSL